MDSKISGGGRDGRPPIPGKHFGIYVYSCYGKPPVLVKPHPALRLAAANASYTQDTARAAAMRDRVAAESVSLGDVFDEALIGELQGQLAAASEAAAGDAAILERIAFLQTALDAGKLNRALHLAKRNPSAEYRPLQEQFMQFLRDNAQKNPVAMNPMYTGFYNAFIR